MTRWLLRMSSGPPSAIISPRSSTVIRSLTRMTTLMSCSISRIDTSFSSRTRWTKSLNAPTPAGSCRPSVRRAAAPSAAARARARPRGGAGRRRRGCARSRPRPCRCRRTRSSSCASSRASRSSRRLPRRAEDRADHARPQVRVHRHHDVLLGGHQVEQPDVLERPGHARRGANLCGLAAGDVGALEVRPRPRSARTGR